MPYCQILKLLTQMLVLSYLELWYFQNLVMKDHHVYTTREPLSTPNLYNQNIFAESNQSSFIWRVVASFATFMFIGICTRKKFLLDTVWE